jgi:hypothetical protein
MEVATPEQQAKRIQQIINEHARKSKRKGDYHFRMAESCGADGDYIPGQDDGEPPVNYERLNQ